MPELNKEALKAAARVGNEEGWSCLGCEPGEYDRCINCQDASHTMSSLIIAAYLEAAQPMITTHHELYGLPVGSVVVSDLGDVFNKVPTNFWGEWICAGSSDDWKTKEIELPARVLYKGEE